MSAETILTSLQDTVHDLGRRIGELRLPDRRPDDRLIPVGLGAALLAAGMALRIWRPAALDLPRTRLPAPGSDDGKVTHLARRSRDGLATVLPDNVSDSLGRTLLITGGGLIALAALDAWLDSGRGR